MNDATAQTLNELIAEAERDSKWLLASYHGIYFTPDELRAANADGRFLWGPQNWTLIDPQARVEAARQALVHAQQAYDAVLKKARR